MCKPIIKKVSNFAKLKPQMQDKLKSPMKFYYSLYSTMIRMYNTTSSLLKIKKS